MSNAAVLRNPVMRAVLLAEAISSLGAQMTYLALPWFVLATTGSATRMGLVFAVELLPVAVLGIPSALLVQRLGVRRSLLLGDLGRAPLVAAVPVLHLTGVLTFPMLLAIVFLVGALGAPYVPAQRLVIPQTFADDETLVVQGNGLLDGVIRLATLLGPAASGVLITVVDPVNVLYIDAATYAASFVILLLRLPKRLVGAPGPDEHRGVFAGARFVLGNPVLRRASLAALLFGFFFPPLLASLPVLTELRYSADPRVAGILFATWGGGAVIGTFGVLRFASRMSPMRMGAMAAVGVAAPLWFLLLPLNVWQFAIVLAVSGIFTPMLNAPVITIILVRAPESVRAKVIAFVMTANLIAGPVGFALAGPALDLVGLLPVFGVVAAGISVAALTMISLAKVGEQAAPAPAEELELT